MKGMEQLLQIMAQLRDPDRGCPWDLQQDYASLVPYTLEEAYEVVGAIGRGDPADLCEELGDLLFQVVFYTQIASEQGSFCFDDVVESISTKLVRRHPHVFADASVADADEQTHVWERLKAQERKGKSQQAQAAHSALEGVCEALPALVRAQKLQRRAARVGFDWEQVAPVLDKIEEELQECREVMHDPARRGELELEIGDLLFSCVNFSRHMEVDAESALRRASEKFVSRFQKLESAVVQQGRKMQELTAAEMDQLWEQVKSAE